MRYTKLPFIVFTLWLFVALCLLFGDNAKSGQIVQVESGNGAESRIMHSAYFLDEDFYSRAYSSNSPIPPKGVVVGGIIPHHLLASHLIASFFQGLENLEQPEVVVLIGPDHEDRSFYHATTSQADWVTPYGVLQTQMEIISRLVQSGLVGIDERVFTVEHSISAEVAFIKRSLPRAAFVPIVLKTYMDKEETETLANKLSEILPVNSLVLASVDFAHYVSPQEAQRENEVNIVILSDRKIDEVENMYVDSKSTMYTLFYFLNLHKTADCQVLISSNTAKVVGDSTMAEVTSYITAYYH